MDWLGQVPNKTALAPLLATFMVHAIAGSAECQRILAANRLVMLKFSATWCGPCKAVAPSIERLAKAHPNVFVGDVDIDKCQDVAKQYAVTAVPSFVFFRNGTEFEKITGGDVMRVKALLVEMSAEQTLGKGNTLGSASSSVASSHPDIAQLRELRPRILAQRSAADAKVPTDLKPKRKPIQWSPGSFFNNLVKYVVLYFATLFSLDARSKANTLSS